mmetsp:Transcript_50940/g.91041  ORF Transcript_50940/g.91041 Transcript_50940/m.91041 type:complete len:517 (-) Transcript_50940:226-1776(-)
MFEGVPLSYQTVEDVPRTPSRRYRLVAFGTLLGLLGVLALNTGTYQVAPRPTSLWVPALVHRVSTDYLGGFPGFRTGPKKDPSARGDDTSLSAGSDGGFNFAGMGPSEGDNSLLAAGPGSLIAALGRRKRILILMSDTGGGHRASAEALAGALEELFPDSIDIAIVDILTDYASFPLRNSVRDYKYLAANPWLWRFGFWFSQRQPVRCAAEAVVKGTCRGGFRRCIEDYAPDMVVSVHPLLQTVPLHVLTKMGGGIRQIPFATVVTDLGGAFPTWFHKGVDLCFVPTEDLYKLALKEGLKHHQLRLHGLPVRKEFWKDARPKPVLQQKLGLSVGKKTALLVGGGDGVGGLEAVVETCYEKLAQKLPGEAQMIVICGKNQALQEKLAAKEWPGVDMHIQGFTKQMSDYMGASDLIVTKAGPGTIAEAAIRGLPVLLSAYLPGQEKGNIEFVERMGFGVYTPKPEAIGNQVAQWLGDEDKLAKLRTSALAAGRPMATYRIAQDLGELLFQDHPAALAA